MTADIRFRRLRGTAVVWGAGWAALGLVAFSGLKAAGILSTQPSWLDGIGVAARFGCIGGIAGTAFSGLIACGGLVRGSARGASSGNADRAGWAAGDATV